MKYFLFSLIFISMSVFLITCGDDGLDSLSYGDCKTGDRRCSGSKLEICTDYKEWTIIADCADADGECIYEKDDYYCSEEPEETTDEIYEWEDEEVEDDGGSQMLDNFTVPDENDEDPDEDDTDVTDIAPDDADMNDEDALDEDIDDSDIIPVCGDGIVEGDEICEKNGVKDCTEIDPVKYTGGKAICDETCMDYNTVTCVE